MGLGSRRNFAHCKLIGSGVAGAECRTASFSDSRAEHLRTNFGVLPSPDMKHLLIPSINSSTFHIYHIQRLETNLENCVRHV